MDKRVWEEDLELLQETMECIWLCKEEGWGQLIETVVDISIP